MLALPIFILMCGIGALLLSIHQTSFPFKNAFFFEDCL